MSQPSKRTSGRRTALHLSKLHRSNLHSKLPLSNLHRSNPRSKLPLPNLSQSNLQFSILRVPLLLALALALALPSLLEDSITFDETSHLTSGMSYLRTGDFRLAPDHPPLAKMWAAWPLLLAHTQWPPAEMPDWHGGVVWNVGKAWLFRLNDGERLLSIGRCMMVLLLLALCLLIYLIARALFGTGPALLSLGLAVLCPTLLAHGRLVTTDLPIALCMLLVILTFARLLQRLTWRRLLAATLSAAALVLVKFSWPLVVPALVVMGILAVLRAQPIEWALWGRPSLLQKRRDRALALGGVAVFIGLGVWTAIWTCYGWRSSPFRGEDAATAVMMGIPNAGQAFPESMEASWESVLTDFDGHPMDGPGPSLIRWGRDHRVLPEAYLFGLAFTWKTTGVRAGYLMGTFSRTGRWTYFPIAFVLKTPIPTLLLILAGLVALLLRRAKAPREPLLFAGLVLFVLTYAIFSLRGHLNIGHRHLLPLYPPLLILAGFVAEWARKPLGRVALIVLLAWLAWVHLKIHPHYLSYFNELIGGPKNGHLYLADSNLDWGQDIKRLAAYARRHPEEKIKLAYFGSGEPNRYGFECEMLPSRIPFAEPCELTEGTYVVSATQLLGVYDLNVRDDFWENPAELDEYRRLRTLVEATVARPEEEGRTKVGIEDGQTEVGLAEPQEARHSALQKLDNLRRARLLYELRRRPEDERIGYSLFVYRLSQAAVDSLISS